MDPRTDAEIVAAVLDGRVEAFAVLVERYRDRYARYAIRMLGSRDEAEEALHAAFIRAFRGLPGCRDPERFGLWLRQIVVNQCRTLASRRRRRERRIIRDEAAVLGALDERPSADPALRDEIEHAIEQLDTDQREAFLLKHVEELSYEEMAEITGVGVSALKMRVKRACGQLRALLDGVHHG